MGSFGAQEQLPCQCPAHQGRPGGSQDREREHPVNFKMSKTSHRMYGLCMVFVSKVVQV